MFNYTLLWLCVWVLEFPSVLHIVALALREELSQKYQPFCRKQRSTNTSYLNAVRVWTPSRYCQTHGFCVFSVIRQDQNVFDSKKKVKLMSAEGVEHKLAKKQLQAIEFNKALLAMYTNQVHTLC